MKLQAQAAWVGAAQVNPPRAVLQSPELQADGVTASELAQRVKAKALRVWGAWAACLTEEEKP